MFILHQIWGSCYKLEENRLNVLFQLTPLTADKRNNKPLSSHFSSNYRVKEAISYLNWQFKCIGILQRETLNNLLQRTYFKLYLYNDPKFQHIITLNFKVIKLNYI